MRIASEQVLAAVEHTKEELKLAQKKFDAGQLELRRKTACRIDLDGGTSVSQLADIVGFANKISDEMYAACQIMIVALDHQCRPYLDGNPQISTAYEVLKLINELIEASEIENIYRANVNSVSYGELAGVQYSASMEAKLIQKVWEQGFRSIPGATKWLSDQEAAKKAEKKAKENKKWEHVKAADQALKEAKEKSEKIEALRDKTAITLEAAAEEFADALEKELETQCALLEENTANAILQLQEQIAARKESLRSMDSATKKQAKAEIRQLKKERIRLKKKKTLDKTKAELKEKAAVADAAYRKACNVYLSDRFYKRKILHKESLIGSMDIADLEDEEERRNAMYMDAEQAIIDVFSRENVYMQKKEVLRIAQEQSGIYKSTLERAYGRMFTQMILETDRVNGEWYVRAVPAVMGDYNRIWVDTMPGSKLPKPPKCQKVFQ